MKDRPAADAETILNRGISGYHEYTADGLPRLAYVSRSLCDMLGCDAAELSGEGYLHRVHPGDRQTYHELLDKFGEGADTVASGGNPTRFRVNTVCCALTVRSSMFGRLSV